MSKDNTKTAAPMDDSVRERAVGQAVPNRTRNAYALDTLVGEFTALFPETPWYVSGLDGRNTYLSVAFDLTTLDEDTAEDALALLLVIPDSRIKAVTHEEGQAMVEFYSNPRTQDSRDSFGLDDAYTILTEAVDGEGIGSL